MQGEQLSVWLLTSELAQDGAGGIARYIENYVPLLARAGHKVTIIARSKADCDRYIEPNLRLIGFEPRYKSLHEACESKRPDDHPSYPYNLIGYAQALSFEMAERVLALLEREPHPDIIESQEFTGLPYYLLHRKLIERTPLDSIPVLVHMHGPLYELMAVNQEPRYRLPDYWTGQTEKFCVRAADAVLAPGRFLAERTVRGLGLERAIAQIPYPASCGEQLPPHPGTPGEILYVGRLQLLKGVLPLLEACVRLWAQGRDFRLTMVGGDTNFTPRSCSMREYISKRFKKFIDAGRLVLAGPMSHADVQERMRTAWAVMVPSLWENFPNVCIEGMSAGQVVIASSTGGQAEMVAADGENGFIFDWEGPASLESRLAKALDLSGEARQEMGLRAQRRIREYCNPEAVLARRVEHYREVIRQYRPRTLYPAVAHTVVPPQAMPADTSRGEVPGLLSVVIPFYNLGAYLRETLGSALASKYRPMEIVILDDGSTDAASLAVLAEVEKEDWGVPLRVVRTENQGLASARNNGADAARGEFLTFLDADDTIEPEYYTRCIEVLKRYSNVSFVYPWVRYFEGSSNIWPTWNTEFPYLLGHNMASGGFSLMRRACFLAAGRNKPEVAYALEDYEMWVSVVERGGIGVSLPEPLVNYRIRKGSMYQTTNEGQQLFLYDLISRLHPEAQSQWAVELFNLQQANGPSRLWEHPADVAVASSETHELLRQEYLKTWKELRRMADAWEAQRAHIEELVAARDGLWAELQSVAAQAQRAEQERHKQREVLKSVVAPGSNGSGSGEEVIDPAQAQAELDELVNSRAWQFVHRVKRARLYRALAQLRFGPGWDAPSAGEGPCEQLTRIKRSRSYRVLNGLKRTRIYSWYAGGQRDP